MELEPPEQTNRQDSQIQRQIDRQRDRQSAAAAINTRSGTTE